MVVIPLGDASSMAEINKTGVDFLRRRAIATRRMAVNFAKLPGLLNDKSSRLRAWFSRT